MIVIKNNNFNPETILEVGIFSILWNEFEQNKCKNNCSNATLKEISKKLQPSNAWNFFANVLNERANIFSISIEHYVDSQLCIGRGLCSCQKQEIKDFLNNNGTTHIFGGLMAIFRIRNNMFHGLKNWTDLDNQIELFTAMNAVLEEI